MGKQTGEMCKHVGRCVNSRSQEAQEAKTRGEDVRRTIEIARESEGCQAQKLEGRRHRDSEHWPAAEGCKQSSELR